jgi:hypothetical protein
MSGSILQYRTLRTNAALYKKILVKKILLSVKDGIKLNLFSTGRGGIFS